MSMSKKDFIALAEMVKATQPDMGIPVSLSTPQAHAEKNGAQAQWLKMRDELADFCRSQNYAFDRSRWLGYIAGENGPSGGKVKK